MYEGLYFSHVKFYRDLSAGLKILPRKPQKFVDNWPLASMSAIMEKFKSCQNVRVISTEVIECAT